MPHKYKSLSIIIPAYNEERFIGACLDAIAAQTEAPDEVIVVDNNSTDRTVEIARGYPFVTVVHAHKQGIVYARDAGFDAAKSEIIGRIDADTLLPKNWVAYIRRYYQSDANDKYAITGGGYFYNVRLPKLNGWIQGQLAFRANRFIVGHYVLWGSNMAILRSQWQAVRSDVCVRDDIHEDLDLGIHLHELGYKITYRESLRVGVCLKRVLSNRRSLRKHMRRWPQTLKIHHFKMWWLGSLGNWWLWYVVQPFFFTLEYLSRLFGHQAKSD
jgi:glycosyltransferase involved in cell wall biosynthesis